MWSARGLAVRPVRLHGRILEFYFVENISGLGFRMLATRLLGRLYFHAPLLHSYGIGKSLGLSVPAVSFPSDCYALHCTCFANLF